MCCKRYHIIFSTFSLKFKCKIWVQKEVIHNFINHILVTWPSTNLLILRKINGTGLKNQITIILFKILPTIRFSKAKSHNLHFHEKTMSHDILVRISYYKSWIWNIKPYLISFNVPANYSIWIEGRGGCRCRWNFITLSKKRHWLSMKIGTRL